MAEGTTIQRLVFDRPLELRPLYVRDGRDSSFRTGDWRLVLEPGSSLSFDTYFNSLPELQWRRYSRADEFRLELHAHGDFEVTVYRHAIHSGTIAIASERSRPGEPLLKLDLPKALTTEAAGRIWFELRASSPTSLVEGGWIAKSATPDDIGLALIFCTFNREEALCAVLEALAADREALCSIACIIVVDQGDRELAEHPAFQRLWPTLRDWIRVVRQGNFGGAGGFTRGIIEALVEPEITHFVLMDDDVRLEPESVYRAGQFFRLSLPRLALGGHMLDALNPLRLYEAGGRIRLKRLAWHPVLFDLDLSQRTQLDRFLDPIAVDYSGWWFFGGSLDMVRRAGLPLPCFIRGDDIEYGRRLHADGIYTVLIPGIAIWHEPFYAKLGSWQPYYEIRNALVTAAAQGTESRAMIIALLKRSLAALLTFDYYTSALITRAIKDYATGPTVIAAAPHSTHRAIVGMLQRYAREMVARERALSMEQLKQSPRSRAIFILVLFLLLVRNWFMAERSAAEPSLVKSEDFVWYKIGSKDAVAVRRYWDPALPVYRRSRTLFRSHLIEAVVALAKLYYRRNAVEARWREALPMLTSQPFWESYLGIAQGVPAQTCERVVAVVVTHNRASLLRETLSALLIQERTPDSIVVVDNASVDETSEVIASFPDVVHLRLTENLGGAGGFQAGIRYALEQGAAFLWLMDDDGRPREPTCLTRLLHTAKYHNAGIVGPLILDVSEPERLAFPVHLGRRRIFDRARLSGYPVIENFAHLFNGTLIRSSVFSTIGLPDSRLFIRGDEVEFFYRAKARRIRIVLDTGVEFLHPSSQAEIFPIFGGLFYAVVPRDDVKQYFQFRNRGHIFRKYRMLHYLAFDFIRYGYYYLVIRKGDVSGLARWIQITIEGYQGKFLLMAQND